CSSDLVPAPQPFLRLRVGQRETDARPGIVMLHSLQNGPPLPERPQLPPVPTGCALRAAHGSTECPPERQPAPNLRGETVLAALPLVPDTGYMDSRRPTIRVLEA